MHEKNHFRILLHLHRFFSDYRAVCRIYINNSIKTISDLQSHISEIFNIEEQFYLISDNAYLPEQESVCVLKENDIVIAAQYKKRKKRKEVNCDEEIIENNVPVKSSSKKKEKKTKVVVTTPVLSESDDDDIEMIAIKKKKLKKKRTSKESSDNNIEENVMEVEKKDTPKKVQRECQKEFFFTPKPNVVPLPICTKPKIVKTIYVSAHGVNNYQEPNPTSQNTTMEMNQNLINKENVTNGYCYNSKQETADETESLRNETCSELETSSMTIEETSINSLCPKPKRKRVRKRKRKSSETNNEVEVVVNTINRESISNCLVNGTEGKNKHIRFNDENSEKKTEIIEDILIPEANDMKEETQTNHITEVKANVIDLEEPTFISEESIKKCPLVKTLPLRKDDIIAFQVLIMGENYTPQISNYVTAKVKENDGSLVVVEVLTGIEELTEPQGRFSLEEENEVAPHINSERQFELANLIDVRLLFP